MPAPGVTRSEEHTSELQSPYELVCRLLLEKKHRACGALAAANVVAAKAKLAEACRWRVTDFGAGAFFFLITPPQPKSTLFPYTTLFRSRGGRARERPWSGHARERRQPLEDRRPRGARRRPDRGRRDPSAPAGDARPGLPHGRRLGCSPLAGEAGRARH